MKVEYYLHAGNDKLLVINAGKSQGLEEGMILNSYRSLTKKSDKQNEDLTLLMGRVKVVELRQETAIAEVLTEEIELPPKTLLSYPQIMAGDFLVKPIYQIEQRKNLHPEITLSYFDLFQEPKASPKTLELIEAGKEKIRAVALEHYVHVSEGVLLIKAFTDELGSAQANQIESYQRALTVRQFMIEELKMDPERVVAIGMGELSLEDQSQLIKEERTNRRILFKLVPQSAP